MASEMHLSSAHPNLIQSLQSGSSAVPSQDASDHRIRELYKLQDTFTAVLEQFGREGFASAEPTLSEAPLETSLVSSWNEWFDNVGRSAYRDLPVTNAELHDDGKATAEQLKQDYGQILLEAYHQGGYAQPAAFLRTLTTEQLATLQTIHRLADPIDLSQLEEEGAINLLIPPPAQVDFDGDGLTQIGMAQTIRFPDSSTSADVRDAWDQATANLSPMERSHYALQMKLPALLANIHVNSNGQFLRSSEPGDADWVNPMASQDYSYQATVRQHLDYLDAFKHQIPPDQYLRDREFWSQFGSLLKAHGAL